MDRLVDLPGDVLRELGRVRRVKFDIKGKIPRNTLKTKKEGTTTVNFTNQSGYLVNQSESNLSYPTLRESR